jgi:hypothetical protein
MPADPVQGGHGRPIDTTKPAKIVITPLDLYEADRLPPINVANAANNSAK